MGILDLLGNLFGRHRDADEDPRFRDDTKRGEETVLGPGGREEYREPRPAYGRFGGKGSADDLRYQNILDAQRRNEERQEADVEGTESPEPEPTRNPRLEGQAGRFSRRVKQDHLFEQKTHSSIRKLEKGVESIESAEKPGERSTARWRFRHKVQPKLESKAQSYFDRELGELQAKQQKELEKLQRRGASEHEIKRAVDRFEADQKRLQRDVDRRLGRPLRGLSRSTGGLGGWRPKF